MKDTKKNANESTKRWKRQSGAEREVSKRKMCILKHQALRLPPKKKAGPTGIMGFVVLQGTRLEDGGNNCCANAETTSNCACALALRARRRRRWGL